MNFKPTLWKSIVSIIIAMAFGVYFSRVYYTGGTGPKYVFNIYSLIASIILLGLIYVVWSLVQKRKRK